MFTIIGEVAYVVQELIYFEAKSRNMSLPLINKLTLSTSNSTTPTAQHISNNMNKIPVASILLCNTSSLNTIDLSGMLLFILICIISTTQYTTTANYDFVL